jgi:hypothetical protein
MPKVSVWTIRMALLYLALGFTFGGLLLAHKGLNLTPALWMLLPTHVDFLLVGWAFQLAFGVAYWILPRFSRGQPRGNPRLPWLAFGLINSGLLLGSAPLLAPAAWLTPLGRLAEFAGSLAAMLALWRRVKPFEK